MIWPDGRKYEGTWRNGVQNGEGRYYATPHESRNAQWMDGVRVKWLSEPEPVSAEAAEQSVAKYKELEAELIEKYGLSAA